jgi:hypothetical protein
MKNQIALTLLLIVVTSAIGAQNNDMVRAHEAIDHAGDFAMVCGVIADANHALNVRGEPTYLNFDKPYPNHDFTAIIWGRDRKNFPENPENMTGYKACVYGKIKIYQGKAQMALKKAEQLSVAPPKKTAETTKTAEATGEGGDS